MYLQRFLDDSGVSLARCGLCTGPGTRALDFDVRMAFQPIVDGRTRSVYAYEALVRGEHGEGAATVLARVDPDHLYRFDQTCRVMAIATAASLGLREKLSINFLPNAVRQAATCIRPTLAAAEHFHFAPDRLIFEALEGEPIVDLSHLVGIYRDYRHRGFTTALDDFGAGYAGLKLLAEFQPDIVKLDMALVRAIDSDRVRQAIARGMVAICRELGIQVLAEGVETAAEYHALRALGIDMFQGYLFARPRLGALPVVDPAVWAALEPARVRPS